jgi:hypothetical protein
MKVNSIEINGDITTVKLTGSVSDAELDGLKAQYGEVKEHTLIFYKVRPTDAEVKALRAELDTLKKAVAETKR